MLVPFFYKSSFNLRSQVNTALKNVTSFNLATSMIDKNYSEAITNCVASDNEY